METEDFIKNPHFAEFGDTKEPSLESLIHRYYRQYFSAEESEIFTKRYIETLILLKDN